jgi:hypothetical protein
MLVQIDPANVRAEVIVEDGKTVTLADLLPHRWSEVE